MPVGDTKFFEPIYKLKTGMASASAHGLEHRMCIQQQIRSSCFCRVTVDGYHSLIGKGLAGIRMEVDRLASETHDEDILKIKKYLHFLCFEENGKQKLSGFCKHAKAQVARLSEAEVVGVHLYTSSAYSFMNNPLRDEDRYDQNKPCPLPVTTYFAASGIRKLRALQKGSGEITLWRGMRSLEVAHDFMQNGGTELAFMSTTRDLAVAVRFCLSSKSLLLKVVSSSFMTMGADVQWLSDFPSEAEILYPPLTYLKPTGRKDTITIDQGGKNISFTVVEVHPQLA